MQFVGKQREQAGLAATVGTNDADLPAGVQLNGGIDHQRVAGAGESDLAEGDHKAANYSCGLLKSMRYRALCRLFRRFENPLKMKNHLFTLNTCLIAFLLLAGSLSAAENSVPVELQADWDKRQAQAQVLEHEGSAKQAEAEKLYEKSQLECQKKFLVNSCLGDARKIYTQSHNEAQLLENEGKAIERQIKKEQLSDSDQRRAAQAPERAATLQAREAETSALRKESAAEQAAQEADKSRKAAEGSKRKAADAERLAKKRAAHEEKVAAHKEKAARRAAEAEAKAAK